MMAHPAPSPLEAAQRMTGRGWVLVPADHPDNGLHCSGSPRRCREGRCGAESDPTKRGKHLAVVERWGQVTEAFPADTLAAWWGPDAARLWNLAVLCGPSRLFIVDEDTDGALVKYAASVGAEVPATFRVRAGRGWHWYFTVPLDEQGERIPLGNSPGLLEAWGCDVRGGASPTGSHGGYAITAGSRHWSNAVYTAEDWDAPVCVMPGWLVHAVTTRPDVGPSATAEGTVPSRTGSGSGTTGIARWDDATRYGSEADLREQFARHCAAVDEFCHGAAFRWRLFDAARDGWRLVALGLLDEPAMLAELDACVWRAWSAEPDERDEKIVMQEAYQAAQRSPWELSEASKRDRARAADPVDAGGFTRPGDRVIVPRTDDLGSAPGVTSGNVSFDRTTVGKRSVTDVDRESPLTDTSVSAEDPLAELPAGVRIEVRKRDDRRAADLYIARRDRVEVRDVSAVEFFAMPPPRYLVPGLIHRDGIAVLFGAPHSGKSFLALDTGLSLASGKPWAGGEGQAITLPDGGPGVVHYVMAEAPGTNIGRGLAWFAYHGITAADLGGRFIPVLDAFLLTEAGIAGYLPKLVRDRPDFIIYDTRSAMFAGKESQGEDYAEMLRAMRTIREVNDKECAQLALDHTGLGAPDRPRGNNAWEAGTDSMILITKDKESGLHTVAPQRVRNERESGAEWGFRRETVVVAGRSEAVLVAVAPAEEFQPFAIEGNWSHAVLPEKIREMIDAAREEDKDGRSHAHPGKRVAKVIMLLLRAMTGEAPIQSKIQRMVNDERSNTKDHVKQWAVSRGCALLVAVGLVDDIGTTAQPRYVVRPEYSTREMPE